MAGSILVAVMAGLSAFGSLHYPPPAPRLTEGPTPVVRANTLAANDRQALNDLTAAIETVTALETRMEFSQPSFAAYVEELRTTPEIAYAAGNSDAESAVMSAAGEAPGSVALLVLRNLPLHATFSEGASAGPGAWAMAAGDPNVLLETMQEGFEEPVVADVEMISSAGRALGFLRLPLQKKIVAATDSKDARSVLALKTPEAAQPLERQRRHARINERRRIARAPEEKPLRRAKTSPDDAAAGDAAKAAASANAGDEKDKPGLMAKFFAWLKGATEDTTSKDDGIRRSLGGPPNE